MTDANHTYLSGENFVTNVSPELQELGGLLRCTVCGREQPLGHVGEKLVNGWPECHGYTMRWITQRQLDANEV